MSPFDLLEDLQTRPVVPLRLYVIDGTTYDIRHPEQCMVGISSVVVGVTSKSSQMPFERMIRIDCQHIHKVEPIAGIPTGSGDQQQSA